MVKSKSLIAPGDQNVTFVELFFDLVFVFAITQVTVLLHKDLDSIHIVQGILIFWLIWWSWQQFTWTLNTLDTTNQFVELATLLSTAIAFFMAIAIPEAFGDRAILFAATYIATRFMGFYLQFKVSDLLGQSEIVKTWVSISIAGLFFVILGSAIGGIYQYVFWGIALVLDLIAANSGGSGDWTIYPDHIAERHGLIIIVALGESLIVAAGGLIDEPLNFELLSVGAIAVVLTCELWWSYFVKPKPLLEKAIQATSGPERALLTRDAFSLAHFPMVAGIISFALAIEEAIAHPNAELPFESKVTLAVGLLLFTGGTALAIWRATGKIMYPRLILISISGILIISSILPLSEILIALIFLTSIILAENSILADDKLEEVKIT